MNAGTPLNNMFHVHHFARKFPMNRVKTSLSTIFIGACLFGPAFAQPGSGGTGASTAPAPSSVAVELSEGEVRKVDKESKKLTLKHGPLKNLGMPGMTMVFRLKDEAMLDKLQAGEKVRFLAEKVDGKFTVTQIEEAN